MQILRAIALSRVVAASLLGGAVGSASTAAGDPVTTASERQYLTALYLLVHPPVTDARLVELGNLTCSVRRSGSSTDDAKVAVWHSLDRQGVVSSNAKMGRSFTSPLTTCALKSAIRDNGLTCATHWSASAPDAFSSSDVLWTDLHSRHGGDPAGNGQPNCFALSASDS
jgi:hypothetical protein